MNNLILGSNFSFATDIIAVGINLSSCPTFVPSKLTRRVMKKKHKNYNKQIKLIMPIFAFGKVLILMSSRTVMNFFTIPLKTIIMYLFDNYIFYIYKFFIYFFILLD